MPYVFRNLDVPDDRPAIYQISIRAPGQTFAEFSTYTFPLSPASLRTERTSMSSYSNVNGPANRQGVTRIIDRYGLAPPIFTIEGTTGADRHMTDGYLLTGLQSIQLLSAFLARYATLNSIQQRTGQPPYTLEFYDYFMMQFWQIEPIGPQELRQAANRPRLVYYRFQWAAVAPVGIPLLAYLDVIADAFATPAQQAAVNAVGTLGAMLTAYAPTGITAGVLSAI